MKRFFAMIALTATMLIAAGTASAGSQVEIVEANDTDTLTWVANYSGYVSISINGDGDTDLDLYVYDAAGNLMDYDISYDDNEHTRFYVRAGHAYVIEVRNLGNVWNRYALHIY